MHAHRSLNYLQLQGGGDCPELSIGGILKGLQLGRPHSYMYVFTDATAKDCHLADKAIELVQQKQSKVNMW